MSFVVEHPFLVLAVLLGFLGGLRAMFDWAVECSIGYPNAISLRPYTLPVSMLSVAGVFCLAFGSAWILPPLAMAAAVPVFLVAYRRSSRLQAWVDRRVGREMDRMYPARERRPTPGRGDVPDRHGAHLAPARRHGRASHGVPRCAGGASGPAGPPSRAPDPGDRGLERAA